MTKPALDAYSASLGNVKLVHRDLLCTYGSSSIVVGKWYWREFLLPSVFALIFGQLFFSDVFTFKKCKDNVTGTTPSHLSYGRSIIPGGVIGINNLEWKSYKYEINNSNPLGWSKTPNFTASGFPVKNSFPCYIVNRILNWMGLLNTDR